MINEHIPNRICDHPPSMIRQPDRKDSAMHSTILLLDISWFSDKVSLEGLGSCGSPNPHLACDGSDQLDYFEDQCD